jgi:hypothetical protein
MLRILFPPDPRPQASCPLGGISTAWCGPLSLASAIPYLEEISLPSVGIYHLSNSCIQEFVCSYRTPPKCHCLPAVKCGELYRNV